MQDQTAEIVTTPGIDFVYYINQIWHFLVLFFPKIIIIFKFIFAFVVSISIPVSVVLLIGIVYSVERLKYIRKREEELYEPKVDMGYEEVKKADSKISDTWDRVVKHIESENENDWRQAIIEADIILGELLTKIGYKGEGIGEQLKRATKADFKTLDSAWEAHKIRNNIAHEGSNYTLSKHDAKHTIDLYKKVFEEFFYI